MKSSALGNRYAHALADVVTAPGSALRADIAVAELRTFEAAQNSSAALRNALASPAVPASRKRAVVARLVDALKLSRITRNFLYVLVDKRRIGMLSEIVHSFEEIIDERLGFARAEITSALELSEEQRGLLNRDLERLTGKKIRMRFAVDQKLIGGVVARIGSTIYDGSVRGQLQTIGRRLAAGA
jgi:F-type H+-transporting ATPase subunit delta